VTVWDGELGHTARTRADRANPIETWKVPLAGEVNVEFGNRFALVHVTRIRTASATDSSRKAIGNYGHAAPEVRSLCAP